MPEKISITDDEFPEIQTGNGYHNDLVATTNDRLKRTVLSLRELDDDITYLNSNLIMLRTVTQKENKKTRSSILNLTKTIKLLDDKNSKQQSIFLALTILGTILAATQIIQIIDILKRGIGR